MRVLVLPPAGSGGPASPARFGAPHPSFGRFVFPLCSAPSGLGLPLSCSFVCLLSCCVIPFARLCCLLLSLVSGPGALGLGALFSFPPSPSCVFFICAPFVSGFLWFPAPGALRFGAVCCLFCWSPVPRLFVRPRCVCVFRLAFGCSLVVAAPPPFCLSRFFSLLLGAPPLFFSFFLFFSSAASLLPACLVLVGGSCHLLPRPPPSSCLSCWFPAARLSVRSRCSCVSRLAVGCSLVVAASPPRPPLLCLAVFVAASRCSVFSFFFFFLLRSCLPAWRSSAVLAVCCPPPHPEACVVPCAVCGALCCLVLPRCAVPPSGVVLCRVAVFCAACRAVVPRLVVLWAADRRAVFVGASVCVLCCAVVCCCVLCRVSGRAVRLGCLRCGLLAGFGLCCRVLCCAVCPGVRCCAALLRVVPPRVVLLCAVLFCCARLVPLLVVTCPLALPVALGPCAVRRRVSRCSPALCALCCVCFVVLVRAVVRRCAFCCVCPGVSCCAFPVLLALCAAVLRCAGALSLCFSSGACCCWRLVLWCAAVCGAVSFDVLWCGAGSGSPWLFAGGVFRCRFYFIAQNSKSLDSYALSYSP